MQKGLAILCFTIILQLIGDVVYSQDKVIGSYRLMFYNVENLFDVYDDSIKDDNAFLADGVMRWNSSRYRKKINSLYKTIVAAGEGRPPVVVALCEVENKRVLEDLLNYTYLSAYNYKIVHEESPDPRGIDVCLLYRDDYVKLIDYRYWIPVGEGGRVFTSRAVLAARMLIESDTLHIIVNHWPSRRGGVLAGEELRQSIASMVRYKTDSIGAETSYGSKIIITGDFNCTPDDRVMQSLIKKEGADGFLVNLSDKYRSGTQGTYKYMGTWEVIDQVIVSERLISCIVGLGTDASRLTIFKPGFLLNKDPKYPGFKPFSTYRGYRYQGGFSDHLPLLLDLQVRQVVQQE
jgi:endonuclease/exonuclease/phosphatase family metal-dependent hydrolase